MAPITVSPCQKPIGPSTQTLRARSRAPFTRPSKAVPKLAFYKAIAWDLKSKRQRCASAACSTRTCAIAPSTDPTRGRTCTPANITPVLPGTAHARLRRLHGTRQCTLLLQSSYFLVSYWVCGIYIKLVCYANIRILWYNFIMDFQYQVSVTSHIKSGGKKGFVPPKMVLVTQKKSFRFWALTA